MPTELTRICVIGPESTGKTTLARRLADWVATEWVPEASRVYAERKPEPLTADDVGPIAREHMMLADVGAERARERGSGLLILDTDLVSTVVYARHYYGSVPAWVERAERERRAALYLLCDVDVPWKPDGIRDRPMDREGMFTSFVDALARRHVPVQRVRGDWDERWAIALDAVRNRIAR
jgi:NadR type nicotinamide-nucleotide adenylyltransferase